MKNTANKILEQSIIKKSYLENYPKSPVVFLAIDRLMNDPETRALIGKGIKEALHRVRFDHVASIASRGYLFSGMIMNQHKHKGEYLIQKPKTKSDPRFIQIETQTEYSTDSLQILKDTIKPGKKYLVTDDLIATGGSVITAIDLIREAGGIVNTVFVMTELVDLDARAKLKEKGVELVSLLKLSEVDLRKILLLQDSYDVKNKAPLTYKLSHYEKSANELVKSNGDDVLQVALATQSKIKKDATEVAFQGAMDPLNVQVEPHDVKSKVSEQPFGYKETLQGAKNRINALEKIASTDEKIVLVSIENGLRFDEETKTYYDFVQVLLKKNGKTYSYRQDCCKVPESVMSKMERDAFGHFEKTWGDVAVQMGMATDPKNPHQASEFGGVSRDVYLRRALSYAIGELKTDLMQDYLDSLNDEQFTISREIQLDSKPSKHTYQVGSKPINFYGQGCPDSWDIAEEKIKRNKFKVFSTGDAFSIMDPEIEVRGAHINIHVGMHHEVYTPFTLLQEGLQLTRCAFEHGARTITLTLPESFHPVLNPNDFNIMLMNLFKASGVSNIYFYDKHFTGKLDEEDLSHSISLTVTDSKKKSSYQINRETLSHYLQGNGVSTKGHFRLKQFSYIWNKISRQHLPMLDQTRRHHKRHHKSKSNHVQPHIVLSGSSNKPLAEKIVASLRMKGEMVTLYHVDGHGENIQIPTEAQIKGAIVTIVQSTRPNPKDTQLVEDYNKNGASSYFFEAMQLARQARIQGADTVNLIDPYQFSARSDKAEDNHNGKTGAYVQQNGLLLKAAGVNHVITAECHDNHTMSGSYTGNGMRGSAVPALTVISTKLAEEWLNDPTKKIKGQIRLVTPDAGAAKRTKELTQILQALLGKKLSDKRVLGEKSRDSHKDDSAKINSLNAGAMDINPQDKYLITDDETATGNTLCQAISNLNSQGAEDISVIVVHNNMPLEWLTRQLCLARFLHMGVSDIHFSDTQEMGRIAKSYDDLIEQAASMLGLSKEAIEKQVYTWFMENIIGKESVLSEPEIKEFFENYKTQFNQLDSKVRVHSLANEFANEVKNKPYLSNANSFELKVAALTTQVESSGVKGMVVFEGNSVPVAAAVAQKLQLPLQVIKQDHHNVANLPQIPFALVGTTTDEMLCEVAAHNGFVQSDLAPVTPNQQENEIVIVDPNLSAAKLSVSKLQDSTCQMSPSLDSALSKIKKAYQLLEQNPKYQGRAIKLLGIGIEGQRLAGQLAHMLNQAGCQVGVTRVDQGTRFFSHTATYAAEVDDVKLTVDRNSLDMGDVCLAIGDDLAVASLSKAVENLSDMAKVYCPYHFSISSNGDCKVHRRIAASNNLSYQYKARTSPLLFSQTDPVPVQANLNSDKQAQLTFK